MGASQAEFIRNRPNNKLKLGHKIIVLNCTLYIWKNISEVRYAKLSLASPSPFLLHTRYITAVLADQNLFLHHAI